MSEITKGPWRFTPYYCTKRKAHLPNRYQSLNVPIPGQELGMRGSVLVAGIKGNVEDYWLSVNDADAKLIAAAPCLLEALREAREWIGDPDWIAVVPDLMNRIDAALKKAGDAP